MNSMRNELGSVQYTVLWDEPGNNEPYPDSIARQIATIDKDTLIALVATHVGVDSSLIYQQIKSYKLFFKILLLLYARHHLKLDYCLLLDNDLFIYEPITEIKRLCESETPFLIPESGHACRLTEFDEFISNRLGWKVRYVPPPRGRGYNIGLSGLDLQMFDAFTPHNFPDLLKLFQNSSVWWKDQALLVSMLLSFRDDVHTFRNEKYIFLFYNHPLYRFRSKIYHAIFSHDKSRVTWYYKRGVKSRRWSPLETVVCAYDSLVSVRRHIEEVKLLYKMIRRKVSGTG